MGNATYDKNILIKNVSEKKIFNINFFFRFTYMKIIGKKIDFLFSFKGGDTLKKHCLLADVF